MQTSDEPASREAEARAFYSGLLGLPEPSIDAAARGRALHNVVLAAVLSQIRGGASALAAFDRIEERLAAIRARDGAPPLLILDYFTRRAEISARFATRPNVLFIATAVGGRPPPEYHIPHDGHPSAQGNEVFAGLVAERLLSLPLIQAAAAPPP